MKKISILFALLFTTNLVLKANPAPDLARFINPLIGTDSRFELSNGNTYPAIAVPWGMNFWTPQTNKMGDGWTYQYSAVKIRGFKQTHQPSPWINDYGAFSLFPTTGKAVFDEEKRQSWFSHKAEAVHPYYYSAYLADYDTSVEIAPTDRCAFFRLSYPETDSAFLVIDAFHKGSFIKVIPEERKIIGYAKNNHGGVPENFKNYFVIYVDKPIENVQIFNDNKLLANAAETTCDHAGAIVQFKTRGKEQVNVRVASSFISFEQAERNLQREIGSRGFDEITDGAKKSWNTELSRVQVEGGTNDQLSTFYTALYRTLLFPRKFYEYDQNNKVVHYSPYNGQVLDGYMFTDNGFWDTFRAVFPFFTLMYPEVNSQIMEGLANTYKESGWLPEWASPGHRDCMIGSNSAAIIADSYLKGIRGYDIETLYEAILKNSENEGPLTSVGRKGVKYYNQLGYIPYNVNVNENTARTLEYAYNDFTIWQLARKLNRPQAEQERFYARAHNYRNVFDPSVNFMRGKNEDGTFQSPFRADKWGDAFTEGCSWHWTWCVFHDPQGLINLMGGKKNFVEKLDAVFTAPPTFDDSYYGFQIHEITEMLIMNMGQYAHGNQPIQHMPYLYNYAGEPWKTQFHVRNIMNRLYTNAPDGLCGDEDNGQTSAWYVFSALGFYPVAPGTGEYVIGTPLFDKATLNFPNGKKLTIQAKHNSADNCYIQKLRFNGKNHSKNYFNHADLIRGGKVKFEMGAKPNKQRGTAVADAPYSMSK